MLERVPRNIRILIVSITAYVYLDYMRHVCQYFLAFYLDFKYLDLCLSYKDGIIRDDIHMLKWKDVWSAYMSYQQRSCLAS